MILFALAYLGGALTIVSPCILPVLPFVFARADQPFLRRGLPMLLGMAATFALVATLAAFGGGWAVAGQSIGRGVALGAAGRVRPGAALSRPRRTPDRAAGRAGRTAVATGRSEGEPGGDRRVAAARHRHRPAVGALRGADPRPHPDRRGAAGRQCRDLVLLLAYAAGAATSLALALLVGGRVFAAMKRSLGAGEWVAARLRRSRCSRRSRPSRSARTPALLARLSLASTDDCWSRPCSTSSRSRLAGRLERQCVGGDAPGEARDDGRRRRHDDEIRRIRHARQRRRGAAFAAAGRGRSLPSLTGAVQWLNSPPLTPEALKGKVVLVDFWTYSCINCLRALPYVRAWAEKYRDQGLVVIGVHAPEFAFETRHRQCEARGRRSRRRPIRWRSTTITRSGAPSTTITGPRIISSTRRAASATTISARAIMRSRKR